MFKSWRSSLQGHHCPEGVGLVALACPLPGNAVLLSHTDASMCSEMAVWAPCPGVLGPVLRGASRTFSLQGCLGL